MRRALAVLAALLLILTFVPTSTGTVHDTGTQFRVFLQSDGDATVELYTEYDLSRESQRAQFDELASNRTARDNRRTAFRSRLDLGQVIAESATGREMVVGDVSLNITQGDDTGIVRLTAPWSNLAAIDPSAGRLVVTAPFGDDRFAVNRTLAVFGPEGSTLVEAMPPPNRTVANGAYWDDGSTLTGFMIGFSGPVATPTSTPVTATPTPTPAPVTGAGLKRLFIAAALAAIPALAVALAASRVRERE